MPNPTSAWSTQLATRYSGCRRMGAEAVKWLRKATAQGDVRAQRYLALMYQSGSGVQKDDAEAEKWFRMAANKGDADSQYNLG